jgi:hypothetical protein
MTSDDHEGKRVKRDGTASSRSVAWIVDVLAGGVIGGIVGWIVAINVVIFSGVESGYQASIPEMFEHSLLTGLAYVLILSAGPVVGVVVARKQRRKRKVSVIQERASPDPDPVSIPATEAKKKNHERPQDF